MLDEDLHVPVTGLRNVYQAAIQKFVSGLFVRRFGSDGRASFVLKFDEHLGINDWVRLINTLDQEADVCGSYPQ